jgi:hypothetical protein
MPFVSRKDDQVVSTSRPDTRSCSVLGDELDNLSAPIDEWLLQRPEMVQAVFLSTSHDKKLSKFYGFGQRNRSVAKRAESTLMQIDIRVAASDKNRVGNNSISAP